MNILIFGANGMAGHMIAQYLYEADHQITVFVKNNTDLWEGREGCRCIVGDVMDQETVKHVIENETFDVVINCIGLLNKMVDANLPEGIYINSFFPHYIAGCIRECNTKLIHISSDCVFSGKSGGYAEQSHPDADSYYGRTKALGEVNDNKNLTLRTSIVGPEIKEHGIGLFHWFMHQSGLVNGFTEVIWSGVTTLELAKAIEQAMLQDLTGIYHLVNNQVISKYALLCLFNQYMNENRIYIQENNSFANDKSLVSTRTDFSYEVAGYEQMIQELSVWMQQHKEWYGQYRR